MINSTKTSQKTESEDTGVIERACVFERVCKKVREHVPTLEHLSESVSLCT